MITFIVGFVVGGLTIMVWAIFSQYIAASQNNCDICNGYHEDKHGLNNV